MRLIDADKLLQDYNDSESVEEPTDRKEFELYVKLIYEIMNTILAAPTIDAVSRAEYEELEQKYIDLHNHFVNWEPVVRCKDCKHWKGELIETSIGNLRICAGWELRTDENDYCSHGERIESNG